MVNREKVIKGLELCTERSLDCAAYCPYINASHDWMTCTDVLMTDALALLKEQEAVKPVVDIDTWTCGNCGHTLEHQKLLGDNVLFHEQYDYCPMCGKKVKWE